jgi:hypothetical protein
MRRALVGCRGWCCPDVRRAGIWTPAAVPTVPCRRRSCVRSLPSPHLVCCPDSHVRSHPRSSSDCMFPSVPRPIAARPRFATSARVSAPHRRPSPEPVTTLTPLHLPPRRSPFTAAAGATVPRSSVAGERAAPLEAAVRCQALLCAPSPR